MDHSEVKYLPKVDHTPATLDEASRVLLKAADVMEQYDFAQHSREVPWNTPTGKHCVLGAIDRASGHEPLDADAFKKPVWHEAVRRLAAVLPRNGYDSDAGHCANWNNAQERIKDEVIAKLRAVAFSS